VALAMLWVRVLVAASIAQICALESSFFFESSATQRGGLNCCFACDTEFPSPPCATGCIGTTWTDYIPDNGSGAWIRQRPNLTPPPTVPVQCISPAGGPRCQPGEWKDDGSLCVDPPQAAGPQVVDAP